MSWYLMHRGWMKDPVFDNEPYTQREAWAWLIENACWEETTVNINGTPIKLQRGQLSYSQRYLERAWGWKSGRAKRFIDKLEKWSMIAAATAAGQQTITICNYCKYQIAAIDIAAATAAGAQQERSRSAANKKELKELKELKEDIEKEKSKKEKAIRSLSEFENHPLDGHYEKWFQEKCPSINRHEKRDQIVRWCRAKGKTYKDYWSALQDWAIRDQKEKPEKKSNFKSGVNPNIAAMKGEL